ncbi:probable sporulation protein, polysaccharide deacetylase family [Seinonella peptonophila]|uniref:Probable sporulation protein, polysaccharide deacetylase family n=2 Tax=Seinonella peptonophila TaxID=112248 RepID=A0A1M5AQF8_9BACL|nr:probable sporulation protein, polysaccharide deacetylase family [Seinonella peptonophila]
MNFLLRIFGLGLTVVFVFYIAESDTINDYITYVKAGKVESVFWQDQGDKDLRAAIHAGAKKKNRPAIDARIDPVWKLIPGYNGIQVDENKTFQKTWRKNNHKKIEWVYREIKPKITINHFQQVPIYRGNEQKRSVALMINVAWGTEFLPQMLEILEKEHVKATFFLDGSWLSKHQADAKKILQAGHELGNHAYSHPLMSQISEARMETEIAKTEKLLGQCCKQRSRWFAPPAGDFNQTVVDVAESHQMKTVLWTVDTVDWRRSTSVSDMTRKIDEKVSNGSLILTHPTNRTVEAFPKLIQIIKKKGLKLERVSDVLSSNR